MRIEAGEHKGRKLLGPRGHRTRPITSRAKAVLFDLLGPAVAGAAVVDLFAGTGSLGLEALSRGARRCAFAERDRVALERLGRNIASMNLADRCEVWAGDLFAHLRRCLAALGEPVDLAFVDPPYEMAAAWRWDEAAAKLFGPLGRHLGDEGTVVFRCRRNIRVPEALGPLCVRRRRDCGRMSLVLLAPLASPLPAPG